MSDNWTIVLKGDWWLPHLVNMLNEYKGNGEQTSCRDEMVEQIESQIDRSDGNLNPTTRPLVVIDPEDREQVKRLTEMYRSVDNSIGWGPLQAALREFADPKPPKPEEPTGLGAVVEDVVGVRWVRTESKPNIGGTVWTSAFHVTLADKAELREYVDIDAVKVLSEGVTV